MKEYPCKGTHKDITHWYMKYDMPRADFAVRPLCNKELLFTSEAPPAEAGDMCPNCLDILTAIGKLVQEPA